MTRLDHQRHTITLTGWFQLTDVNHFDDTTGLFRQQQQATTTAAASRTSAVHRRFINWLNKYRQRRP
jgi:hypothetical protein